MVGHLKNFQKSDFSLDRYDNETHWKEFFVKYRPTPSKRKKPKKAITRNSLLDRNRFIRDLLPTGAHQNFDRLPKSYYAQQIRDAIATVPVPGLLPRLRRKMNHQVLNRYDKRFTKTVNDYLKDVGDHYSQTIREFHLNQFTKLIGEKCDNEVATSFKFKQSGRTVYHKKFLRHRKILKENLFIPYPFIRFILHSSNQSFPHVLNNYGGYRKVKSGICVWLDLIDFETVAQRDLENSSIFLREEWYPKVVQVILKHYRKRTFTPQQWIRMLNCAKGLINRQITELKINTFEHIFDVFAKRTSMPPIKFQAVCTNGRIQLNPTFRELLSSFKRIFKNIAGIATKFPPLDPLIDRMAFLTADDYLKIDIGEVTLNQMMERLETALKIAYTPVLEYIDSFEEEFWDLLSDETREDLDTFLGEPKQIDEYFEKIATFRGYIEKIQQTVRTRIFDNATVNQNKALVGLRTIAQDYIDEITEKIAIGHKKECQKICDWFANVQRRALEAPQSTETLLANGEFMLQMKNKKIAEIRQHIQNNLKVSGRLMDLAELSEDHFNLQISTIHWLHNIQEIFEQNASQFELYKNQFEEHLGAVTKKLTKDIDDLIPQLAVIDDMYDTNKLHNYYATLEDYIEQIKCFEDYIKWINKEEKLFKLPVSQYPIVESLQDYVKPFVALIKLCIEWLRYYYIWMDGPFEYLNAMAIENFVQNYMKEFEATQKYYRNRIKADMLGDPLLKFRGQTEDPDPEKHPVPLRLCSSMINWINGFQIGVSIVKIMCNPALRDRHWAEMSSIAGFDLTPDAGTSLRKITKYGIDHLLASFEIISIGANKELKLQMDLAEMIEQWRSIDFPIDVHKDTEIQILGNIEDIQVLLDDHTIKTLSMRGSAFVKPCEQEVRHWYEKLLRASQIFDEWIRVQSGWLYLLPILSSKDISDEMPNEEKLFTQVNDTYCKYINMAIEESNIMKMMETTHLLEDLISANEMLEKVREGVYAYLERKRLYFSRFFFLSNNEMLQILSETKNPENIQPFLCKCFNGIWRVKMNNNETIDAMLSRMNEEIPFPNPVSITGASVEKWLLGVENEMQLAIQKEMINSYADYLTSDRINWALSWPQMIVLVVANIFWTSDIHASLLHQNRELLANVQNEIQNNLDEITTIIRSSEMTNLNRITLKTLCILDVHARDVTQQLIDDSNSNVDCFQWISQMRYYWNNNEVSVQALNYSIPFGNEYLGNFQRIVMTPLSERCFLSVLLAFQHQMNASIEGPTATGKSETIKDLAKAFAVQLKVFDCTPDLNFHSISQFLKGVASSGAWLCLEDFDRIDVKTLSVVAQQLRAIQMASRKRVSKFFFEGVELKIKSNCNICIMSNPCQHRSELPDNLKTLFRPVVMMSPNIEQITEVSLYAAGYENANLFAKRITEFYKICSELLPPEMHYDFGLRNIKITLRVCANRMITRTPNESDENLIYNSLLDVNLPKINANHLQIFRSIIDDIFPKSKSKDKDYKWIRDIFESECIEKNYQPIDSQYRKLLEAYESLENRPGLMLIGNPYTGKSFILQTLIKVMAQEKGISSNDIECAFINPRAIELSHLFDDIVSSIFRQNVAPNTLKWIVFDGPIHSDWAENLNTVLDDNRKLCLSSGEMLDLTDNTSFIFEVHDLSHASPSTISRIEIVHFEANTLDWKSMATSWMNSCSKSWINECKSFLWDMFEWILPLVIDYVNRYGVNIVDPLQYNLLNTTFDIIQMLIDDVIEANTDDYQKFLISWIQAAMIYGIAWGIGGVLNEESRKAFDQFHRKIWSCGEEYPPPNSIKNRLDISLPNEGCLNDYCYIFKQKGTWKLWIDMVRRQEPEVTQEGVFVATIDTARYSHLIEMHIKHGKKSLLVGPSHTSKTYIMQNILKNKINTNKITPVSITFNLKTNAKEVHEEILSKLVKLRRGVYGPAKGMNCTFFIDNLNIPDETYSSYELIRQIFDYGFVYDLKSTSKIQLENISILAACGSPGGRNQNVDLRFLNHFNSFSIDECSEESLSRIFNGVLMNGYKRSGHAADVIGSVNQIVSATMYVYAELIAKLKPTPNKSHYCFNMRDILRVCIGCSMMRKESVENKKMFAKVWFHEMLRVFHDRLFDLDEKSWVYERLAEQINDTSGTFKDSMEIVFETYVNEKRIVTLDSIKNFIFGSYLDTEVDVSNRKYEEISSLDKLANISTAMISEYPEHERCELNVILFNYALEHLNRICRIISMPGGNGLIIGYVDSGRRTLVRLATIVCKQKLSELRIEQNYSIRSWKEDIKRALKSAGGKNEQTVLFLSENHLSNDAFLIDIDYLLNTGDIPNLWPIDERQELLEMVRLVAQGGNRNIDISADEVFSFFVNRCHQNLHIILSFHSTGSKLRNFIRLYPSLINCCTIDAFEKWPENALEMVATKFLSNLNFSDEKSDSIISAFKYFHSMADDIVKIYRNETSNRIYVTPSSYLEFVHRFAHLFEEKQNEISTAKSRYVQGLDTLQQAAIAVENMQIELSDLEPKLRAMAENCYHMTKEIELKTIEANVATEQVKRDELIANEQAASALAMEDECSKDLAQAVPVLEDALQALNTLKPADITLVKSMKNPPSAVKLVMAAVCVMKGVPPDRINDAASGKKIVDYWGPSKRVLGDMGFLQSLKDYDKDDISPDIMKKIRKDFISHKDFQPHIVAKASSAAEGLCKWIKAIENFESVNTVVRPKKQKLIMAKANLKETRKYLAEKRKLAAELDALVDGLNEELEKTNSERERTEQEVVMCEQKLKRAEALIASLGQEKNRWTEKALHLQTLLDHLLGDVLISTGLIAYLGALPKSYREQCTRKWHAFCKSNEIPCSEEFSLISCLGNEETIRRWQSHGLASDEVSTENAILMVRSRRQCLFIDPQMQANKWIKRIETGNQLMTVKQSDPTYFDELLDCMKSGRPILIEDIFEPLNVCLDQIFTYRLSQGSRVLRLHSDFSIEISSGFRLYLTSNAINANFIANNTGKINIINFIFALPGLEETLLDILVLKENPYLREERDQLLQNKSADQTKQMKYENAILTAISECEGDILEDETAIKKMDASKQLYVEVINKQLVYIEAERNIEVFRESYRKVSAYAAVLYNCLDHLRNINPMYQFSLDWYFNMYNYSIENANRSRDRSRRTDFLVKSITKNLYRSICRSIFDADKLLFSWIITTNMLLDENRLKSEQLDFFISKNRIIGPLPEKPNDEWITDDLWLELNHLVRYLDFDEFLPSIAENSGEWKFYLDDLSNGIPKELKQKLSSFQRLMIAKVFHPENFTVDVTNFIASEVGEQFVNPPHFNIHKSFEESNILTPLIFILSPGVDPTEVLWSFAEKLGYSQSMEMISLGADQGNFIEEALLKAQKQGSWICLQNCHLNTGWLMYVEKMWKNLDFFNTAPSFRLWMTSEPTENFPLNLLQNGIKITYEKARGLKSNLLSSYQTSPLNGNFYDSCPEQDKTFKKLLYSLTFFDVVINERKQYGNIGWNVAYEFVHGDFIQSIEQLQAFLNNGKGSSMDALHYIISECTYGGRIIDQYDKRLLKTLLEDIFNEKILLDPFYKMAQDEISMLPRRFQHRMVVNFIEETMPSESKCKLYGLHANSDFIYKLSTSNKLVNAMSVACNSVRRKRIGNYDGLLSELLLIIEKLPKRIDETEASSEDAMKTVLATELEHYNRLWDRIRNSCYELHQAIEGNLEMTPTLEHILGSLSENIIPEQWMKISYPSKKTFTSYLTDFCKRYNWFRDWWLSGEAQHSHWFSAFFFPRSFLAALKLNSARRHGISLEKLTFDYRVLNEMPNEEVTDGACIHGLFLKAAHWTGEFIDEQQYERSSEEFPVIHIKPTSIDDFYLGNRYECPVYHTSEQRKIRLSGENAIMSILLPIKDEMPLSHWIKRGVVLVCQNEE